MGLYQECYTLRHKQVRKCQAVTQESRRTTISSLPASLPRVTNLANPIAVFREAQWKFPPNSRLGELETATCVMVVDVGQLLRVSPEMAISKLRPYLVLWSNSQYRVYFVELTIPWEDLLRRHFIKTHCFPKNLETKQYWQWCQNEIVHAISQSRGTINVLNINRKERKAVSSLETLLDPWEFLQSSVIITSTAIKADLEPDSMDSSFRLTNMSNSGLRVQQWGRTRRKGHLKGQTQGETPLPTDVLVEEQESFV